MKRKVELDICWQNVREP